MNRQFGIMDGQLREMRAAGTQTDQLLSLYGKQVDKYGQQVTAMNNLVTETRNTELLTKMNFVRDQPPCVWASSAKPFPIAPNERLTANIYFVNYGKSQP
jgi:hypothetical protein